MLHHVQLIAMLIPIQCYSIANTGGIALSIFKSLSCLVCTELPDTAMLLQQWTGIHAGRSGRARFFLACVRGSANIHVNISRTVKGKWFNCMLILFRETANHCFWVAIRNERL